MNYWRGYMDWAIRQDWVCETCDGRSLEWELVHGRCRCVSCHTEYYMRDLETNQIIDTPICMLKDEYKESVKQQWTDKQITIDEMDFSDIERAL